MSYDTTIPSFLIPQDGPRIDISIDSTNSTLTNSGITYNQSGVTFNQAGQTFDGLNNQNQDQPRFFTNTITDRLPTLDIAQTEAMFTNQGYTYNQAGFSFNQAGVEFAGFTNQNWDMLPLFLDALQTAPHITIITDTYTTVPPTPNTNHSVGPGWFMYVTIP